MSNATDRGNNLENLSETLRHVLDNTEASSSREYNGECVKSLCVIQRHLIHHVYHVYSLSKHARSRV